MIWVSIILSIIEAIPSLVTLFKEAWTAAHSHAATLHALTTILLKHQDVNIYSTDQAKAAVEDDLRSFYRTHVLGLDS